MFYDTHESKKNKAFFSKEKISWEAFQKCEAINMELKITH